MCNPNVTQKKNPILLKPSELEYNMTIVDYQSFDTMLLNALSKKIIIWRHLIIDKMQFQVIDIF